MKQITAVIPTLSNQTGLTHLLGELEAAGVKAVVIDNSKKNMGFAAAVNTGITQAETEWILIANDDIEGVTGEKLTHMLKTAEANGWVAVSPILRHPGHDLGSIENIGYQVLPIGKAKLNFDPQKNSDKHLDGLTMASLLIKKSIFEKIGGLDESFVAYLEDVDFFLRLKKAGYHFGVDSTVEIVHNHMTTSKRMPGFKEKRDFINWIKVIRKNWDKRTLQKYWFQIMIERLRNLWGWVKTGISK